MKIAFFDFDGTITNKDSFLRFIKFCVGDSKYYIGLFKLFHILLAYKLKIYPNYKAKEKVISYFFANMDEIEFKKLATNYSLNEIDKILREKAIQRLMWHKNQNHKVVIVSASIDCWLRPWCEKNDVELLATKLEIKNHKITGKLQSKNCFGKEKVNRINKTYNLKEYEYIFAYGDSSGDNEMLAIANESFFKPFE